MIKLPFLRFFFSFFLFVILELVIWDRSMLLEGSPIFSLSYYARSLFIILIAVCFVYDLGAFDNKKGFFEPITKIGWFSAISSVIICVVILSILVYDVGKFSKFSLEDGWVEYGSAVFSFLSSFILFFTFLRVYKVDNWIVKLSILGMSGAFFILAMEEISWFQRILKFETPELMQGNIQNEINFHNYGTNFIENAYYFGVFVLLSVIPLIYIYKPELFKNLNVEFLVPGSGLILIGCIVTGLNYDMWNVFFMQFMFYLSIMILILFFLKSKASHEKLLLIITICIIISSQLLFFYKGQFFIRPWEPTEYRELILPLGLFFYAMQLYGRSLNLNYFQKLKIKSKN